MDGGALGKGCLELELTPMIRESAWVIWDREDEGMSGDLEIRLLF
jgi:hypothetical protein